MGGCPRTRRRSDRSRAAEQPAAVRLETTLALSADARDEALNRPAESQVVGDDHGLDPVPCADLGEDPPDVSTRIRERPPAAMMRRVASIPSTPGVRMSIYQAGKFTGR
jgi:hypothetical protein